MTNVCVIFLLTFNHT